MEFGLHFGAVVPSIKEQIKEQRLEYVGDKRTMVLFERDFIDITRLHVRGYLNDSTTKAARQKLLKMVARLVVKRRV
jgi:hypothetical protein